MSLAVAGLVVGIAGLGMSMYGSLASGKQEARAAKAQSQIAELQASAEGERADEEADQLRDRARAMASYQRAAYSASGFDLSGSPMLVVAQTLQDSEKDIINLYKESDARRLAYKMQAGIYSDMGKYARTASYWQAGSSLLTGVGQGIATWKGLTSTSTTKVPKVQNA